MKEHFSKIGFVLAMAGSAVGLGNAWKFPTMVGQNGGSAFILLYLLLTILVAFVVFLAELSIGRLSRKDSVNAFYFLANKHKKLWSFAGFFMIAAILIVCFYSVVIGWIVYYIYKSFFTLQKNIDESSALFEQLLQGDISSQIICFSVVFAFIFLIVNKGIKNGIEKMNVFMMPALFVLLLLMLCYSFSFDGFLKACEFLFYPDFSKLNQGSILNALGLSFFSMSIGVCAVLTYAASLPDKINIIKSTLSIILINVLIGIMMGLVIFTFIFEFGADSSSSGPGLIFVSLTNLFAKLGILGNFLALAFFISLFFAGVTSAVSMIEPFCFYLINRFKIKRSLALFYIGIFVYIVGVLCILSSAVKTNYSFTIFSYDLFSLLDFLTSNILMPLSAIIICIFVGFCMNKQSLKNFFIPYMGHTFFLIWINFLKFICPIAIIIIAISNFM